MHSLQPDGLTQQREMNDFRKASNSWSSLQETWQYIMQDQQRHL